MLCAIDKLAATLAEKDEALQAGCAELANAQTLVARNAKRAVDTLQERMDHLDRAEAAEARCAELSAELEVERGDHDRTANNLGLTLTRAEAAEAERDLLRGLLDVFVSEVNAAIDAAQAKGKP